MQRLEYNLPLFYSLTNILFSLIIAVIMDICKNKYDAAVTRIVDYYWKKLMSNKKRYSHALFWFELLDFINCMEYNYQIYGENFSANLCDFYPGGKKVFIHALCKMFDLKKDDDELPNKLRYLSLFIINDVFYKIYKRIETKIRKKTAKLADIRIRLSILLHVYWHEVVIGRFILYESNDDNARYVKYYFQNCEKVIPIKKETFKKDKAGSHELYYRFDNNDFYILFKARVESKTDNADNEYQDYSLTLLFSAIPDQLYSSIKHILSGNRNDLKESLYYYLLCTQNDITMKYDIYREDEEIRNPCCYEWKYAEIIRESEEIVRQNIKSKGGGSKYSYQKNLRKFLLNYYTANPPQIEDFNCFLTRRENKDFIKSSKRVMRGKSKKDAYFQTYREKIAQILDFLKNCGGLNLFPLFTFRLLNVYNIRYPSGYLIEVFTINRKKNHDECK